MWMRCHDAARRELTDETIVCEHFVRYFEFSPGQAFPTRDHPEHLDASTDHPEDNAQMKPIYDAVSLLYAAMCVVPAAMKLRGTT